MLIDVSRGFLRLQEVSGGIPEKKLRKDFSGGFRYVSLEFQMGSRKFWGASGDASGGFKGFQRYFMTFQSGS